MRLLNVLPWALLVATALLVTAHPIDNIVLASRADADASLLARDPTGLDLLVREYLSTVLFPRTSPPERAQFKTDADYRKAWSAWHRRNGKFGDAVQRTMQKHDPGDQPEREQFASHAEYDKAWRKWTGKTRKVSDKITKLREKHDSKMDKEQRKHIDKSQKKAEKAEGSKSGAK
ncbi:hypothetical protein FOMPIDRAFT_1024736 [Fomitopsis schrenkii]|uniref:Uncharacterized protein n=1 Tax=Fomitopsis schrenkii TaxID=2126942 RepID=S8DYJ6_FOMSC|nr:hypothetical protein FOMPIDRAFT_1024736 [Fomitopsis schrenkii]